MSDYGITGYGGYGNYGSGSSGYGSGGSGYGSFRDSWNPKPFVLGVKVDENGVVESDPDTNPYLDINIGRSGSQALVATIIIDLSGSVSGEEENMRDLLIELIWRYKRSSYRSAIILRVIGYHTDMPGGVQQILPFTPVRTIDPDTLPHFRAGGMTNMSQGVIDALNESLSLAVALREREKVVNELILKLGDGGETHRNAIYNVDNAVQFYLAGSSLFMDRAHKMPLFLERFIYAVYFGPEGLGDVLDEYFEHFSRHGFNVDVSSTSGGFNRDELLDKMETAAKTASQFREEQAGGVSGDSRRPTINNPGTSLVLRDRNYPERPGGNYPTQW